MIPIEIGPKEITLLIIWVLVICWFVKTQVWPWLLAIPFLIHSTDCKCSACKRGWSIKEDV